MLPLILLILKIILFAILGVLAAVLITVSLLLFVPFGCRVRAEKREDVSGLAAVSWLFGLIRVVFEFGGDGCMYVRAFGFKIRHKEERRTPSKEAESAVNAEKANTAADKTTSPPSAPDSIQERSYERASAPSGSRLTAPTENNGGATRRRKRAKTAPRKPKREKRAESTQSTFNQIWELENKGEIVSAALILLKRLLKIIFGVKINADIKFGTGSPDTTGILLGACFAACGLAGVKINAEGDFENQTLTGRAEIKGTIFICAILWAILLFVFNKNIFRLISKYIFRKG